MSRPRRKNPLSPVDCKRLVGETLLSECTVIDWALGRRACAPSTERLLRSACEALGIRVPRKHGGRANLYALFPDIRLRVSAEERAAFLKASESAGMSLGVWVRNLACRAIGREPRSVRNTGAGTAEQLGVRRGPESKMPPVACVDCGAPVNRDAAQHVKMRRQKNARCIDCAAARKREKAL